MSAKAAIWLFSLAICVPLTLIAAVLDPVIGEAIVIVILLLSVAASPIWAPGLIRFSRIARERTRQLAAKRWS